MTCRVLTNVTSMRYNRPRRYHGGKVSRFAMAGKSPIQEAAINCVLARSWSIFRDETIDVFAALA